MTSHVDQSDVASIERCVADIKMSDGQTSSYTACDDPEKPSASSLATMQQFHADWSQFETVFARGLSVTTHLARTYSK